MGAPDWKTVPMPGQIQTSQADILRAIVPRVAWAVLGIAAWGATVLLAMGLVRAYQESQRYNGNNTITVEVPIQGEQHVVHGVMYKPEAYRNYLRTHYASDEIDNCYYCDRRCTVKRGCYEPDWSSEIALLAFCLILVCVDFGLLTLTGWLLWGAMFGRRFVL